MMGFAARDDLQETVAALAIMMTGISRIATDLQTWNTMEFGFLELDDAYLECLQHHAAEKKSASLEHVKAVAAMSIGTLNTVLAAPRIPPLPM